MLKQEPLVAIIITNFNGSSIIYKGKPVIYYSLSSVKKTNYGNYKCVFADDSSTDNSIKYVKTNFPLTHIVVNKPNGGYTVNTNCGVREALRKFNPDYILLMNNDVIINDKDWLKKLVEVAELDKKIGIVGCKFLYPNGNLQHAGEELVFGGLIPRNRGWNIKDAGRYEKIEDVELLGQAVALVKRSVIDKIGLWDENFRHGNDDVEYCMRAKKAGFRNVYDGKVRIIHLEGFSLNSNPSKKSDKDKNFPLYQYQYMYLAFKHFGAARIIGALALTLTGSIIGIGSTSTAKFKFRDRIPWRFNVTLKAIKVAYMMNNGKISKDQAYSMLVPSKAPK